MPTSAPSGLVREAAGILARHRSNPAAVGRWAGRNPVRRAALRLAVASMAERSRHYTGGDAFHGDRSHRLAHQTNTGAHVAHLSHDRGYSR